MSKKKKFVYARSRPTNISFNGISFPVQGGDIVFCTPEFIEARVAGRWFREVQPGSKLDSQEPKYTFGAAPVTLRKDPTGGLPMRSSSDPKKKVTDVVDPTATELEKKFLTNDPYELVEKEKPFDITTSLAPKALSEEEPADNDEEVIDEADLVGDTTDEAPEEEPEEIPETIDEVELEDEEDEEEDDLPEPPEPENEGDYPGRTTIRRMGVEDLKALAKSYDIEGADDMVRGVLIESLFERFGYMTKE